MKLKLIKDQKRIGKAGVSFETRSDEQGEALIKKGVAKEDKSKDEEEAPFAVTGEPLPEGVSATDLPSLTQITETVEVADKNTGATVKEEVKTPAKKK